MIDCVDSMTLNLERRIKTERGLIKYFLKTEYRRVKKFEREISRKFLRLIVTADRDAEYLGNGNEKNIDKIPVAVDIRRFFPDYAKRKKNRIIFSGNMKYYPNNQAVVWFLKEVIKRLSTGYNDFEFVIAGKNPSKEVKEIALLYENVYCTGFVDSMVDELNQASIAVAPMQSGSGMQGKILEAMSCGVPVITTTLGKGSIRAQENDGLFIADTPEEFLEEIKRLLSNNKMIYKYGMNARIYIEKNHDVSLLSNKLSEVYRKCFLDNGIDDNC